MADNQIILKTRLLNKYNSSVELMKGEINFIPATMSDKSADLVIMQVGAGDGVVKEFAAKASDVHSWAKASSKPAYKASEIEGLESFIAGEIQDTNTKYSFNEENGQLVIKYKELSDADWKQLKAIDIVTPTELTNTLNSYVTSSALTTALASYATTTDLIETNSAVAAVKKTADAAAVKTEVNAALANKVDKVSGKSLISDTEIARLANVDNYDDSQVKTDIKANADAIKAVEEVANAAATKTALNEEIARATAAEQANANAIDAIEADYLKAADITNFETKANVKAVADDLAAEVTRAKAAEKANADAIAEVDAALKLAVENDQAGIDSIKELATWVNTHGTEAAAMAEAIDGLEAQVNIDGTISEYVADQIAALNVDQYATDDDLAAEAQTRKNADDALSARIKTYEDNKASYATKTEVNNAITTAANDATTKANDALAAAKAYADANDSDTTYSAKKESGIKLDGTVFSLDTTLTFILDGNA